jgi:outer membrane protein assembly factor BamA
VYESKTPALRRSIADGLRAAAWAQLFAAAAPVALPAQADQQLITVTAVRFRGNHVLPDDSLSVAIATSASSRLRSLRLPLGEQRFFDEVEFRRDVVRLALLYRRHGYYEARIDTVVERAGDRVSVAFVIDEGPPIVVDSIGILGADSIVPTRRLLGRLPLAVGKPFNRYWFDAAADTLVAALRDRGYPFVAVYRNFRLDRAVRLAYVDYEVVPGPRARVGEIVVRGRQGVSERTVRRSLAVREGDRFSQEALYDSQRSLYQTDLFRFASVSVAPDSVVGGQDSLVRILVQVTEGARVRVRTGLGYGTIDCFRAQSTVGLGNFLGGARRMDAAMRLTKLGFGHPTASGARGALCPALAEDDRFSDTLNYYAGLTLTQPALFARRNAISLTAFAERRSEFKVFERVGVGASAALAFGVGRDLPVSLTYRVSNGRTRADTGTFCVYFDRCQSEAVALLSETHRQASVGLVVVESHTDSPLEPTRGHHYSFEATLAAAEIGSEFVYRKAVAEATLYRPLARGWTVALRLRGGIVRPGTTTLADSAIRYVPPEERFYAGGPTTVRGFGRNEMGPVVYVAERLDSTRVPTGEPVRLRTSPTGSSAIALANVELRLPSPLLPSRLRLAAFVDVSRLWDERSGGLAPTRVFITPGLGVRIGTPLGPMRLDAAYNAYPRQAGPLYVVSGAELTRVSESYAGPKRSRFQFHFSVGQPF